MNITSTQPQSLITHALRARAGAGSLEQVLGLQHNRSATIAADLFAYAGRPADPQLIPPDALPGAQAVYASARTLHSDARATLRDALNLGRTCCGDIVDALKRFFGRRWNSRWRAAGFTGNSIALPRGNPVATLMSLSAYLHAHPEHETPEANSTAARVDAAVTAISTAQALVDSRRAAESAAQTVRDAAFSQLRRRITALRQELTPLLPPDDVRWYRFGFQRPIDRDTPPLVEGLEVLPGSTGTVIVRWEASARAENYRVTWRVMNAPEETEAGLFADLIAVITGLPAGSTIVVAVSARNGTGESLPTEAVVTVL